MVIRDSTERAFIKITSVGLNAQLSFEDFSASMQRLNGTRIIADEFKMPTKTAQKKPPPYYRQGAKY